MVHRFCTFARGVCVFGKGAPVPAQAEGLIGPIVGAAPPLFELASSALFWCFPIESEPHVHRSGKLIDQV